MASLEEFYKFLYNYDQIPVDGGVPINDTALPDYMYKDPEHYPEQVYEILSKIAEGDYIGKNYYTLIGNILDKKWGTDVRATLALSIYLNGMTLMHMAEKLVENENHQETIESEFIDLEKKFEEVIANATVDSEVINARDSELYGQFTVLDARLENIEKALYSVVPHGALIKIKRQLTAQPFTITRSYEYGLGMTPLGLEPEGLFGGTLPEVFTNELVSWDNNLLVIRVPEKFVGYEFVYRPENDKYILSDGKQKGIEIVVKGGEPLGQDTDSTQVVVEQEDKKTGGL